MKGRRLARRKSKNETGISRIEGIPYHDAWVAFVCVNCKELNTIKIGQELLSPEKAYETQNWKCDYCDYIHSKETDLPFDTWHEENVLSESITAQSFWAAFFRISTEHIESYWKQCNVCGRILPFSSFSKHSNCE